MYGRYSLSGYVSHTSMDEKTQEYNCQVIHIKEHDTYKLIHWTKSNLSKSSTVI